MVRRTAVTALLFLVTTGILAAESQQRYVVALKPSRLQIKPSAILSDIDATPRERDVASYTVIDGFAADMTAAEAAELRKSGGVRYVEAVVERHALGVVSDATRSLTGQTVPFGIDMVRARALWDFTRGENVNVVVIDTGVDYRHPDLAPSWAGGYNALTKSTDPLDDNGHGTHVSGTIAAADNDLGVLGIAPRVRLWGVKVLKADGNGTSDKVIAGLDWVVTQKKALGGRWIVNLSLGSPDTSIAEEEAFARAIEEGLLIVAAAGNESTSTLAAPIGYPAAYAGVMAIGAVDATSKIATFSNQGPQLAVVAPGVDVLSSIRVGTGSIAGVVSGSKTYASSGLTGSKMGTFTGGYVVCGVGRPSDFPASVAGKIALIQRGASIKFADNAKAAKAAGASAVIIYNNDESALTWTLINDDDPTAATFEWPLAVALSKKDGEALAAASGNLTVTLREDDYAAFNGTSMSSPHVAGVGALLWSLDPSATAENLRQAMTATASDLGAAGVDSIFGAGLVDALNAAKQLKPALFSAPVTPSDQVPSGRRTLRRGRT